MDASTPILKYTMTYQIPGRIKPAVRMTQRSKYVNKQARAYLEWKNRFGWDVKTIRLKNDWHLIPMYAPVYLEINYYLPVERNIGRVADPSNFDTSNVLKAVEDAIQGIIYENDVQVEGSTIWRHFGAERYLTILKVSIL